jgi:hypothetical protein
VVEEFGVGGAVGSGVAADWCLGDLFDPSDVFDTCDGDGRGLVGEVCGDGVCGGGEKG